MSAVVARQALIVAMGGFVGVLLRYGLIQLIGSPGGFPLATLTINLSGAFLLGALVSALSACASAANAKTLRLLLGTGVLGGYTTYSGLAVDGVHLFKQGETLTGTAYLLVTVGIGLAASFAGWWVGAVWERRGQQ